MDRRRQTTANNKRLLLQNLTLAMGIVTTACKASGLDRSTFYKYYNRDAKFKKAVDDIENETLDFVETSLLKQIKSGDTTATIFYLKTKGRKRGYTQKEELDLDITSKGEKVGVNQDEVDAKFERAMKVLEAIKARQNKNT